MPLHNMMSRLLEYNLWVNERMTSWLHSLDKVTLYQATGSSFGTIDRTLQHILAGQLYWYEIIVNSRITDFELPLRENSVEKVMEDLVATSKKFIDNVSQFSEEELVARISASDSTQCRYEYILHLVNHGTYHRGQVVTMARALGVKGEVPVTDYDAYLWWLENKLDSV